MKKILISNVVTKRFAVEKKERASQLKKIRERIRNNKKQEEVKDVQEEKDNK